MGFEKCKKGKPYQASRLRFTPFLGLPLFVRRGWEGGGGTNKSRQSAVSFRQQPDHCLGHLLFQGFEVQSVVCKC